MPTMISHSLRAMQRPAVRSLALILILVPRFTLAAPPSYGNSVMGAPQDGWAGALLMSLDLPESPWDVGPRVSGEFMYGAATLAPQSRSMLASGPRSPITAREGSRSSSSTSSPT